MRYNIFVLTHIALAIAVFTVNILSTLLALAIFILGFLYVLKTKNKNNEVLIVCAYITGAEVFIRATDGAFLYEFAKYGIIFFMTIGIFYSSFSKNIFPYVLYLLLLLPALLYTTTNFILTDSDRKIISFTISGPVCLGVCAIYCYQRSISLNRLYDVLLALGLPIISLTTYLILFNPSVRDVVTGTDSSGALSGGFGPNQVSTVVGLGIFVFLSRIILVSKSKLEIVVNTILVSVMVFRGIVTFSRGGMLAAAIISAVLLYKVFKITGAAARFKILLIVLSASVLLLGIWSYSVLQTKGLIANRYAGQDAAGRQKASKFTGREELAETELSIFYENPILGCGVSRSIKIRESRTGINAASHNELTRLLAEHGFLGILILFILFTTPVVLSLNNKQHFFLYSFLLFWLLTINHAAMRIAAPAFVYALALLQVSINTKPNQIQ